MSPVTPHPSTQVAHEVLEHFLAEWTEAVARELRAARPPEESAEPAPFRVLYVDAFCNSGGRHVLVGPGRSAAPGSAARGVRALDRLAARAPGARVPLHAAAVLVEADPAELDRLERELERTGAGHRVRRTDDPSALAPGDVALLHMEWADAAERVARLAAAADHALCYLAPPAPGKLPLASLRPLLAVPAADVLLTFPHADLQKQARYRGSTIADLPAHARQLVEGYSALFGDARYEWLSLWRDAERAGGGRAAEARLVERYAERLTAGGRAVRRVDVRLSDEAADSLYLFLAARDPLRALALNQGLRGAGVDDRAGLDRTFRADTPAEPEEAGTLELFALDDPEPLPGAPGELPADLALLSRTLRERFRGRTVAYGEVVAGLADTDLTPDEVRRAMAVLKRTGEAVYRGLSDAAAEVAFPETPVPPARPKKRARRGAEMPLLGLEPEAEE
ncbi:MAG: three-Cys-motif partner protein TcmP [Gemmatimonadota bacterium]